MTPAEIKQARQTLGLTTEQFGAVLKFKGSVSALRARVSEVETGAKKLSPEKSELLKAYLSGYRCADWPQSASPSGPAACVSNA
jgi:hypothetical protein